MFLIDNNLSPKLAKKLRTHFPNMAHVMDFGLEAVDDYKVWAFAKDNNFTILTKDTDFVAILNLRGFPPEVVRLNCGNMSAKQIEEIMVGEVLVINDFLLSPLHGLLVIN